jgi:hypothetical protein
MSAYTNPTNIFNFVPVAVLQWCIAPFLLAEERAEFNAVLEPTERIVCRFPKDAPIMHAVRIGVTTQRRHGRLLNFLADHVDDDPNGAQRIITAYERYAEFLCKPIAAPMFRYRDGTKERAIADLRNLTGNDAFILPEVTVALMTRAIAHIDAIQMERHVGPKKLT